MQLGKAALLIVVISLALVPLRTVLAESAHFDINAGQETAEFSSSDNAFKLKIKDFFSYRQPLDVYLFRLPKERASAQINALTEIYSYYVYSSEVTDQTEFELTISYASEQTSAKTIYYLNPQTNQWAMASRQAFINKLTFKLKGKANQVVVVGTNLAETSVKNQSKVQVSEIYNFNIEPALSQLTFTKVCRPYLTSYFKSSKANSEEEVKKLQTFLRENEGFSELPSTGYYGNLTAGAVKQFQEKYRLEVLKPWGLTAGTGWVLASTLTKINQVYCQKNPEANVYQINLPYQAASKHAKNAYLFNNGAWERQESYDDYKNSAVTAIIDKTEAQLALFEENDQWVGQASWYAYKNGLFAASRDFPKGARLKVTNQAAGQNQGKSVVVEINDYGPELKTGRIIDLDKQAFQKIGDLKAGVLSVRIEQVKQEVQ